MTVKELIETLQELDPDTQVYVMNHEFCVAIPTYGVKQADLSERTHKFSNEVLDPGIIIV